MIVLPDPALAPVMPPVIVPTVHVYVLGITEVRLMFEPVPLQTTAVKALEIIGACETVIVLVAVNGAQGPLPSGSLEVKVNVTTPA